MCLTFSPFFWDFILFYACAPLCLKTFLCLKLCFSFTSLACKSVKNLRRGASFALLNMFGGDNNIINLYNKKKKSIRRKQRCRIFVDGVYLM